MLEGPCIQQMQLGSGKVQEDKSCTKQKQWVCIEPKRRAVMRVAVRVIKQIFQSHLTAVVSGRNP